MSVEEKLKLLFKSENKDLGYSLILSRELCQELPDHLPFQLTYAAALRELIRYKESQDILDFVELKASSEELLFRVYSEKGLLLRAQKKYSDAIVYFQKAIDIKKDDARFYIFLGSVFSLSGKYEQAKQCFRNAIGCAEGPADEAYLNLGYVMRAQERFQEALECFENALRIDPSFQHAHFAIKDIHRAITFRSMDDSIVGHSKAERLNAIVEADGSPAYKLLMSRSLVEDYKDCYKAYIHYASVLREISRFEESRNALEKAMNCCPDEKLCFVYLQTGYLYEHKGDYANAIDCYLKCIELKPSIADFYTTLGKVLYQQGTFNEAKQYFMRASDCTEGVFEDAYYYRGLVLRSQEKFEEAGDCFKISLQLDPDEKAQIALNDIQKVRGYYEAGQLGKKPLS